LQIPAQSTVCFSSSYKKSSNHQVIRTPIFCSPTTVDEEPKNHKGAPANQIRFAGAPFSSI
ncbi:hypothetical protein B8W98_06800, partial [Lentilactobacillus parakefiri]